MSKQIIEAISKAFNRGIAVGKDEIHGFGDPQFIKTALKEEIEDALRKLVASQPCVQADGENRLCEHAESYATADGFYCPTCGYCRR